MSIVIGQMDLHVSIPNRDAFFEKWKRVEDNNPSHDPVEIFFTKLIGNSEVIRGNKSIIECIKSYDNLASYSCAKGVLSKKHRISREMSARSLTSILFFGTVLKDELGCFRIPVLYSSNQDWFLVFRNLNKGFYQEDYLAIII